VKIGPPEQANQTGCQFVAKPLLRAEGKFIVGNTPCQYKVPFVFDQGSHQLFQLRVIVTAITISKCDKVGRIVL